MSNAEQKENIKRLKNELLELRENVKCKMNRQLLLNDRMAANYQRMTEKCDVSEKELEKIFEENARYKFVGQCLINKVEALTGCKIAKGLTGSGKDDGVAALHLEVCSNKLLAELTKYRDQAEEASRTLAEARDRLAKASETEDVLKRCATNLTVLAEADRTRRDCEEAKLRTAAKRLTAELGDLRCDADRLRAAVDEISDSATATGCEPAPVSVSGQGLREENFRLQAELKANSAVLFALRERVAQLETALQQQQQPCTRTECV